MKKIVNLTPHTITVLNEKNEVSCEFPSQGVARAAQSREKVTDILGIPVNKTVFGEVQDLPEPEEDTIYIVSALTAQAAPDRTDLYIVDDLVRDEAGRIIGCRALAQINEDAGSDLDAVIKSFSSAIIRNLNDDTFQRIPEIANSYLELLKFKNAGKILDSATQSLGSLAELLQ